MNRNEQVGRFLFGDLDPRRQGKENVGVPGQDNAGPV